MKIIKERYEQLENDLNNIIANRYSDYSSYEGQSKIHVDGANLKLWVSRVKKLIEDSYGKDSDFYIDFVKSGELGFYSSNYEVLIKYQKPVFDAAKADVEYIKNSDSNSSSTDALGKVENLCNKFHTFARQLQRRHAERQTIDIEDEYDLQDVFHALLKIHFDDVRAEEYTPSYAGSATRMDFLLKSEKIIIELKKTRRSLKTKEVGEQLIIDIAHYQSHPDCETLVCFVYDPEGKIANPAGVEHDLEKCTNNINVKVIVSPK
ncbi:hypothetical protein [Pectobacterium brasiliense]|uniref:PD-(D/E)XK nuclease domain-containing protein n=1 Tax=Pectobacterium brasiliense TaxID=180957 RepID=UPI00057CFC98|nr:hypothetical protein [Pectobacterium brasiliense]KHS90770.1 malate dehydrogenase [Pectobacterium brasiliense]